MDEARTWGFLGRSWDDERALTASFPRSHPCSRYSDAQLARSRAREIVAQVNAGGESERKGTIPGRGGPRPSARRGTLQLGLGSARRSGRRPRDRHPGLAGQGSLTGRRSVRRGAPGASSADGSCSPTEDSPGWARRPVRMIRFRRSVGSGTGIALMSACVYGWRGSRYMLSRSASSATRPRYMTATRSLMCSTTPRLWAMNR